MGRKRISRRGIDMTRKRTMRDDRLTSAVPALGSEGGNTQRRPSHPEMLCSFLIFLLALVLPGVAAAINFTPLNQGPCQTSGGQDVGGFCADIGIDYDQSTGNFVTSVHYNQGGTPNNLDRVDRVTGARVPVAGFVGANDELKVATVRQVQGACTQQWPVGTIFTGNQNIGQIVKIENGVVSNPWITLPDADAPFRGEIGRAH